jgi:hypothetical protein
LSLVASDEQWDIVSLPLLKIYWWLKSSIQWHVVKYSFSLA